MALTHTDTNIPQIKINSFSTLDDFVAAQQAELIGEDEISFIEENVNPNWNQNDSTKPDYIKNKPTIPTALSQLSDDSTHRLVTDTEKSTWNGKGTTFRVW